MCGEEDGFASQPKRGTVKPDQKTQTKQVKNNVRDNTEQTETNRVNEKKKKTD